MTDKASAALKVSVNFLVLLRRGYLSGVCGTASRAGFWDPRCHPQAPLFSPITPFGDLNLIVPVIKPDSEKSTTEHFGDKMKGTMDSMASSAQPEVSIFNIDNFYVLDI